MTDEFGSVVADYLEQHEFEPDDFRYGIGETPDEAHETAVESLPYPLDDTRYTETKRIQGRIGDQHLVIFAYTLDIEGGGSAAPRFEGEPLDGIVTGGRR